jgi:hypothetical protein
MNAFTLPEGFRFRTDRSGRLILQAHRYGHFGGEYCPRSRWVDAEMSDVVIGLPYPPSPPSGRSAISK